MPPVGFEPIISAGERPQTYALDCAATGTGSTNSTTTNIANQCFAGQTQRINPIKSAPE